METIRVYGTEIRYEPAQFGVLVPITEGNKNFYAYVAFEPSMIEASSAELPKDSFAMELTEVSNYCSLVSELESAKMEECAEPMTLDQKKQALKNTQALIADVLAALKN